MNSYYATFGVGDPFKKYYVPILAKDEDDARSMMNFQFKNWCTIYTEESFDKPKFENQYGLKALPTIIVKPEDAEDYRISLSRY